MNRLLLLIILSSGIGYRSYAQKEWILKDEKDSISVFTRNLPDSKFKAIKVKCVLTATLSQFVAILLDVGAATQWVYNTKSAVLVKQVSPWELYYYSEVNIPWPLSNRDFVSHLTVVQDPHDRVVTVNGPTVADYVPEHKGVVRVTHAEGTWIITPLGKTRIKIEYTLRTDPGGNIPTWLVNLFVTKGPLESFQHLKAILQKPVYVNAHLAFIKD
jgi:hypothetical protein